MLFVSFLFGLGTQSERGFSWNMGLMVLSYRFYVLSCMVLVPGEVRTPKYDIVLLFCIMAK